MANWFFGKVLEQPGASPVSSGAAWVAFLPYQSSFAGGSGGASGTIGNFYAVPPAFSATVGTIDCYTDVPNLQSIAGGSNYVIPPMSSLAQLTFGSGTICNYQMQQGSLGNWVTLEAFGYNALNQSVAKYVYSDGVNFRFLSSGGVTVVSFIVPT